MKGCAALLATAALLTFASSASAAEVHAFASSFGTGELTLTANSYLAVNDTTGDVYVADTGAGVIKEFEAGGTFVRSFGTFTTPSFVAVDNSGGASEGDVYVADSATDTVSKFEADGTPVGVLDGPPFPADPFEELDGIAVNAAGDLFVLSGGTRMTTFAPDSTFGEEFTLEFGAAPLGIAIDDSTGPFAGSIYTRYAEGPETLMFSPTGANTGEPDLKEGTGIAVDASNGDLYVAHATNISRYSASRTRIETFGSVEPEGGELQAPAGIAVNSTDHGVYLADAGAQRIDLFDAVTLPTPTTGTATGVTPTTATLNGEVNPEGTEASYQFEYLDAAAFEANDFSFFGPEPPTRSPVPPAPVGNDNTAHPESTAIAGLQPNTTYHFRIVASDPHGTNPGAAATFSTTGPPAILSTSSSVLPGACAILEATVNPDGIDTSVAFEYGTTAAYGSESATVDIGEGSGPEPATVEVCGLTLAATYHFRAVATNTAEPAGVRGPDATVSFLLIDSTSASTVSATAATLQTEIDPFGSPATYHFEYDTRPYAEGELGHGTVVPIPDASVGSGQIDVARTAQIQGLSPLTTYYFRVVAHNSFATVIGPDRSFTTQGAAASLLPDNRVWEQVSPPNKQGVPLESIPAEGGVIQAAAQGSAITYIAKGAIVAEPAGDRSSVNSQDLSRLGADGWSTEDIATPHQTATGLSSGNPSEYKLFSPDLSLAAVEPSGATPLSPQAGERTPYLRQPDRAYTPLITTANVPADTPFGGEEIHSELWGNGVEFVTATSDLRHLLLISPQALTAGFEPGFEPSPTEHFVYEWTAGSLALASQRAPGSATLCGGTAIPCVPAGAGVGNENRQVRNAVSSTGERVIFTAGKLYLRDLARGETVRLDAAEARCGSCESGVGKFQFASVDDSRVFFTAESRLTSDSTAAAGDPDLYLCQIEIREGHLECDLTDISVDHNSGESADIQGAVLGGSEDGSSIYFVANGALTGGEGAVDGSCSGRTSPASASCNVYLYDVSTGVTKLVAVLSGHDHPDWFAQADLDLGELTARVSPNGRYLAFMSSRPLTGYDNIDVASGERDLEVYLYDAAADGGSGKLVCASCSPTGARPRGVFDPAEVPGLLVDRFFSGASNWQGQTLAANIPGWTRVDLTHALYQSRYLSDSGRLFFNAADALVPQDSNGVMDVYEYEPPGVGSCTGSDPTFSPHSGGCVGLISSGTSPEESAFLDASESGDDVYFLSASKLASTDVDHAFDIYDARVDGRSPEVINPVECAGDGCQQPAVPPNDPTPGSLGFSGAGNILECPKGKVKQKGKCVKKKQAKKNKKKHHKKSKKKNGGKSQKKKRTGSDKGGRK